MLYHRLGWQPEQWKQKMPWLKWPPINISNTTTNQKHAGVTEERKARRFGRGGALGSIILGAIELGGDKKLNKLMISLINIFLGQFTIQ
jgi:hypothetical protein